MRAEHNGLGSLARFSAMTIVAWGYGYLQSGGLRLSYHHPGPEFHFLDIESCFILDIQEPSRASHISHLSPILGGIQSNITSNHPCLVSRTADEETRSGKTLRALPHHPNRTPLEGFPSLATDGNRASIR